MKSRIIAVPLLGAGIAMLAVVATPALAYWQFFERPPGVEIKPSPRYATKGQCEAAFKIAEARLKMAYPDRYPLIGSCEEFR